MLFSYSARKDAYKAKAGGVRGNFSSHVRVALSNRSRLLGKDHHLRCHVAAPQKTSTAEHKQESGIFQPSSSKAIAIFFLSRNLRRSSIRCTSSKKMNFLLLLCLGCSYYINMFRLLGRKLVRGKRRWCRPLVPVTDGKPYRSHFVRDAVITYPCVPMMLRRRCLLLSVGGPSSVDCLSGKAPISVPLKGFLF